MKIVVRADASLTMGSGHIMRCLTLADRLQQQGHDISFICRQHDGHLADLIGQKGFAVQLLAKSEAVDFIKQHAHSEWLGASESDDFAECKPILQALKPDWLIIDHYAIGKNWEQQAKRLLPNLKILAIDDLADRTHDCEILLDQNFGRKNEDYQPLVPSDCQQLLGTRYTLLRDEFANWRAMSLNRRKSVQLPNNILVNLGGVDNDNVTLKILQSLNTFVQQSTQSFNVTVVMGKTAPHIESVQRFAKHASFACAVLVNVTNMAQLMANADLAIGAAGSTTWERCCLGLPMVLLVLADNQQVIAKALADKNVVKVVTDMATLDEQLPRLLSELADNYKKFSRQSAKLVDGQGAKRVAHWIEFAQKFPHYQVRQATQADSQRIWQWRNHVDVRRWMFGQDEIALADHEKWYRRQLDRANVHLLIFEVAGEPMGLVNVTQMTVDKYQTLQLANASSPNEKTASWGFYLSPNSPKGQGLGFALGVLAIAQIFNATDIGKITAQVLAYNTASLALHRKLGFSETGVLKQHFGVGDKVYDVVEFELKSQDFLF
ncbi:MAG TPA: UDP-2,4-diacetamido-2,4,6-trideoxy-beta-L-altropyranose hydrolase [Moraxellaceae bacterium]|nr:UDP-2,4-diacetamido-2,4,6-trideoxy-beta-L-altropyranose hydrolase [Moraxellaceae bacterium]